jgi:hypothetical protein
LVAVLTNTAVIRPGRGEAVVTVLFGDICPDVWVSDMPGGQRGHGVGWQVCPALLLRDAQYAIDRGDTAIGSSIWHPDLNRFQR